MSRTLMFKKLVYDTQIGDGQKNIIFFGKNSENDESITELIEEQIVKWLFKNQSFKLLFCEDLFENYKTVQSFYEISQPFTIKNKKPGDIDLLLVDPNYPEKTIVLNVKE